MFPTHACHKRVGMGVTATAPLYWLGAAVETKQRKERRTNMANPAINRFTTIEVDLTQPGGWRLLAEPRRIIACLKACEGIATEDLERMHPWELMELRQAQS